jgi:class 3 adenylate cyclase/CHASE2 domain-containing sensor protein
LKLALRSLKGAGRIGAASGMALLSLVLCYGLLWDTNAGLSIDLLNWLTKHQRHEDRSSIPSAVTLIGIDEETFRDEGVFRYRPRSSYTPELAAVLDAVQAANPKVIGFDAVFPVSNADLGKNYDTPFYTVLRSLAEDRKVVLGFLQNGKTPIVPFPAQVVAVGADSVAPLNVREDADGVVRSVPLAFSSSNPGTPPQLSFAAVILARARGLTTSFENGGALHLGDRVYPDPGQGILLNFNRPADGPNIHSLVDLYECARAGDADFFRRNFENKIVLISVVSDVEDRLLSSQRFATDPLLARFAERCKRPIRPEFYTETARQAIPGALIHARLIDNLLDDTPLTLLPDSASAVVVFALALVGAILTMATRGWIAMASIAAIAIGWIAGSAQVFFFGSLVLPLLSGLAGIAIAAPLGLGLRAAVFDRARARLFRDFTLYLPPAELKRLMAAERTPSLGGELRPVSILFSDIAGFTQQSETAQPAEVVTRLNAYFEHMVAIVDRHGGFVDKFIGDGLLAVFGAPVKDPQHAAAATAAALEMEEAVHGLSAELVRSGNPPIDIRIGVHSGEVIVGNIGSSRRFNYTVIGDAVNLASRLEGVAKQLGVSIVVSEATRAPCFTLRFRPLGRYRVLGRGQPVSLFEPLAESRTLNLAPFSAAVVQLTAGDFDGAEQAFAALAAAGDVAAAKLQLRAAALREAPPENWDGVINLTSKGA